MDDRQNFQHIDVHRISEYPEVKPVISLLLTEEPALLYGTIETDGSRNRYESRGDGSD